MMAQKDGQQKQVVLSKRMEAVAGLVTSCQVLADVGTDHGYIPIAMVQRKRVQRAIAMDLRTGPLERAREHIHMYGQEASIETRLSDGVEALKPGEADAIVVAGMGGELVIHILQEGEAVCRQATELILQPQSELAMVRRYLTEHGYVIQAEDMVLDEGKYYPMMRVAFGGGQAVSLQEEEALYGPLLLQMKHPVLQAFLQKEDGHYQEILSNLKKQPYSDKIAERMESIQHKIECNHLAMARYGGK